jgi:hypothetical protein
MHTHAQPQVVSCYRAGEPDSTLSVQGRTGKGTALQNVLQRLDVGRLLLQLAHERLHPLVDLLDRHLNGVQLLLQRPTTTTTIVVTSAKPVHDTGRVG